MTRTLDDAPAGRTRRGGSTRCPDCTDGLGQPRPVVPGSFRERVHSKPGLALAWRIGIFVAGLLFVLLGLALTVLPGPLTIPPVLLGLWVWSTEFDWARRIFATFARKGRDAWKHAKQHPVSSAAVTVGGLAAAALVFWAVGHFELVDKGKSALGI
jgi:Putative transmembrane protein (PGPGW)